MSRHLKHIISLVLVFVMISASCVFAADPVIISPSTNGIINGDSVLISVKFTEVQTVEINLYKQQYETKNNGFVDVNAADYTEDDLALIAAGEKKDAKGKAISLSNGDPVRDYSDNSYISSVTYKNETEMGFYTKQVNNVKPGLYRVCVDVKDASGKVTATVENFIAVKEKVAEEQASNVFNSTTTKSGPLQFLQKLLKSLFSSK